MPYRINGNEITIQPTTGRWVGRDSIGIDGNGKPVYVGVRAYELKWQLIDPATFNQLVNFFNGTYASGTASVDLPAFGNATYVFQSYSGCVINEPEADAYFSQNQLNASLLITNIK